MIERFGGARGNEGREAQRDVALEEVRAVFGQFEEFLKPGKREAVEASEGFDDASAAYYAARDEIRELPATREQVLSNGKTVRSWLEKHAN